MTSRRGFFLSAVSAAVAAGAVLDLDKLLWVPGAKKIFIPPQLWVPDCSTCKEHVRNYLARNLTRIAESHKIDPFFMGHLFTDFELKKMGRAIRFEG